MSRSCVNADAVLKSKTSDLLEKTAVAGRINRCRPS